MSTGPPPSRVRFSTRSLSSTTASRSLPETTCPLKPYAAARAATRFGTIYCTSHASTATIEEIGAATPGPKWIT